MARWDHLTCHRRGSPRMPSGDDAVGSRMFDPVRLPSSGPRGTVPLCRSWLRQRFKRLIAAATNPQAEIWGFTQPHTHRKRPVMAGGETHNAFR